MMSLSTRKEHIMLGSIHSTCNSQSYNSQMYLNYEKQFRAALHHGLWKRLLAWLKGCSTEMKSLSAEFGQAQQVGNRTYGGAKTVEIEKIIGSESRGADFDAEFNPLNERSQVRWVRIMAARMRGDVLPPIDLIQVGDRYYVRDGHHRVSVARAFGEAYIDAVITVWRG